MLQKKYKLNDVAKDLNMSAAEVTELLEKVDDTPKKPTVALSGEELDFVFESIIEKAEVDSLDDYFAVADLKKEKDTTKATEKKVEETIAKKEDKPVAKTAVKKEAAKPAAKVAKTAEKIVEKAAPKAATSGVATSGVEEKPVAKPAEKPAVTPVAKETPKGEPSEAINNVAETKLAPEQKPAAKPEPQKPFQRPLNQNNNSNNNGQRNNYQNNNNNNANRQQGSNGLIPNTNKAPIRPAGAQAGAQLSGAQAQNKPNQYAQSNARAPKAVSKPMLRPNTNQPFAGSNPANGPTVVQNEGSSEKERTVRHVDTKTVEVNLDKYNERYEQIAPDQSTRKNDTFQRKQKINQKSQQRKQQKYSNKKETESQKLQRLALERARKQQLKVMIPDEIVVSELASRLKVTASDVVKRLMLLDVMATATETIDFDTASLVAMELGAKVEKEVTVTIEERLIDDSEDDTENLVPRNPIVVVMGHVDHGKTSLLDRIRHAEVTSTEAGGITQHIGAYTVKAGERSITFLDTPGHEAFTSMRARGASVTDIAILVVAADDGIMPQTVEAINHAKAAGVAIIVAINKIDKETANVEKVKQELTEYELVPEEWGGDIICCPVSASTGEGIPQLLEMVNLVADMADLKANPNRLAKGTVVEARLDKGRGPVATLLVQNGTLHTGDVLIAGSSVGRVRVLTNDKGIIVEEAGPSVPVEITGLAEVPSAGDTFNAVEDERLARALVDERKYTQKEEVFAQYEKVTLDNLFNQIAEGEMKELAIIVKADVQGSAEAVKQSLEKLTNEEVRVRVIHNGVGAVTESDLMLAKASQAIIIGFNVRPDQAIMDSAADDEIEIRLYRIIYDAIDDVKQAMKGMLAPKTRVVDLGRAEVRSVFKITNVGTVSGCYVLSGKIFRSALIRVVRDSIVIAEDKIVSLKRFKDDAKEVAQGFECGIGLEKYNDIKEGDIYESFIIEEYRD